MTRYPRAEAIAETMSVPMMANDAILDLYGHVELVLDERAARARLGRHGIRGEAYWAAMSILEERAERLSDR